ncbi:MAG: hypothetical protein KF725_07015 [Cyclobacteriaceae bacterium]|nr:hypothetical protein [Cyclobacteriaceae bacterium]UYN88325.1 MAG: hypothetical protein KIT51_08795 [Cyclobacteriaceae bacterium]
MKHACIIPFLFLSPLFGFTQDDLTELDKRNGFKNIKMGMHIDSVAGSKFKKDFKEKGHYPAKLYEVIDPENASIGEVAVNKIEVKTYKDLIYEISVITAKDTRLMKGMESALGKPIYDVRNESYTWMGKNLTLKFRPASKTTLELLYSSAIIRRMMEEDKKKKIDDIADDF